MPERLAAMPANICERITPELPRAPRTIPLAACSATSPTPPLQLLASLAPPERVDTILSPVSPSGMGNTFSSLISSAEAFKLARPPARRAENSAPPMALCNMTFSGIHFIKDAALVLWRKRTADAESFQAFALWVSAQAHSVYNIAHLYKIFNKFLAL